MPEKATKQRAARAKRAGKSPSTQAGEFVREEIHHVREGKHGAKSAKQAIAIGLNKARKSGVKVKPKGKAAEKPARRSASKRSGTKASPRRATATRRALKRQPRAAASRTALSRQAKSAARTRTKASRSAAARKGARTRARNAAR